MRRKDNTEQPSEHKLDESLWSKVLTSKQVQGLAWKIEKATQVEDASRELVEMIVRKWAQVVKVKSYFPDLEDVFTPEAVFLMEYAHRRQTADDHMRFDSPAWQVYDVLAYVSNLVANHEYSIGQLKRLYNNKVKHAQRCTGDAPSLPLFDEGDCLDRRKSENKELFKPEGFVEQPKATSKQRRTKAGRIIERYLVRQEPKFSIGEDGQLRITI
jgi:hypothetical protein